MAHFQSHGGATRNNDFCLRSLEQMRPLGQCQIYHWRLHILRSEQLGISFINSYSPLHSITITLSTIFKSSEWYFIVLERRHMLWINITLTENGDIASLRITVTWTKVGILHSRNLKLTWSIHFEMIYVRRRIIGLLQSQDLDGKPTFGFIITGWSVNELFCLEMRHRVCCCRRRPSTFKIDVVCWEWRLGLPLDRVVCVSMSWSSRSRLYGNVVIKKYPPFPPAPYPSSWGVSLDENVSVKTRSTVFRYSFKTLRQKQLYQAEVPEP